jgi:glycosyltransferase involved in cell wall biosynthesis
MRICFIADARSPIARGWIDLFRDRHDLVVLSSFPIDSPWEGVKVINLRWMNWLFKTGEKNKIEKSRGSRALRRVNDYFFVPLKTVALGRQIRRFVAEWKPDVVHALRIPVEGQAAALAGCDPLIVSVWGNDFTLHARKSFVHWRMAAMAVRHARAVIADCETDLVRAREFGLSPQQMTAVVPGGGGLDFEASVAGPSARELRASLGIPDAAPLVLNPRGARPYVRNDTFLQAVDIVRRAKPEVVFLGVGLRGWPPAESFIVENGLQKTLLLTGHLEHSTLLAWMKTSEISVSPSEHDGTPNSLIEAMAEGSFPICGDLPSIREWITDGKNGLLFNANQPKQLARQILEALARPSLRQEAVALNRELTRQKADRRLTRERAEALYGDVAARKATGR